MRARTEAPPRTRPRRPRLVACVCAGSVLAAACGGSTPPPEAGSQRGGLPDLRGRRVMVYPVQMKTGVEPAVDAELVFALNEHGAEVDWIMPDRLREVVASSPGMDMRVDGLPVAVFLQAEVNRVGDPLFGYLRRTGALIDSDVALIPVFARRTAPTAAGPGEIEMGAALMSVRTGYVLWYGIVAGEPGPEGDARVLASAADALAMALLPYGRAVGGRMAATGLPRHDEGE